MYAVVAGLGALITPAMGADTTEKTDTEAIWGDCKSNEMGAVRCNSEPSYAAIAGQFAQRFGGEIVDVVIDDASSLRNKGTIKGGALDGKAILYNDFTKGRGVFLRIDDGANLIVTNTQLALTKSTNIDELVSMYALDQEINANGLKIPAFLVRDGSRNQMKQGSGGQRGEDTTDRLFLYKGSNEDIQEHRMEKDWTIRQEDQTRTVTVEGGLQLYVPVGPTLTSDSFGVIRADLDAIAEYTPDNVQVTQGVRMGSYSFPGVAALEGIEFVRVSISPKESESGSRGCGTALDGAALLYENGINTNVIGFQRDATAQVNGDAISVVSSKGENGIVFTLEADRENKDTFKCKVEGM